MASLPGGDTQRLTSALYMSGDWAEIIIGMRSDLRVQRLEERYSEEFQVGFLASMRFDVAAGNAAAVGRLIGIQP